EQTRPVRDYEIWLQLDFGHLVQGHSPAAALAAPVDDVHVGVLRATCAEALTQAHRIADRAQRLIGDNYAKTGGVERLPISRAKNSRHIGDNVVKLRPQDANQLVNCLGGESCVDPQ